MASVIERLRADEAELDARLQQEIERMLRTSQVFNCPGCGKDFYRPPTRGQLPTWCPPCRADRRYQVDPERRCAACGSKGNVRRDGIYCSAVCARAAGRKPSPLRLPFPSDPRSAIRRAVEDGTLEDIRRAVRLDVTIAPNGCWLWERGTDREGYARVNVAGRTVSVHRLVMGEPRGPVVHHTCATRRCVNPDHLQLVTVRENTAEMLERQTYLRRIAVLEDALRQLDASHPALPPLGV